MSDIYHERISIKRTQFYSLEEKTKSFWIVYWSKVIHQLTVGSVQRLVFEMPISPSLGNTMTYFSPASIGPPWTRTWVTVLGLGGFGGCITVMSILSIFVLADHNSTLDTSRTTARTLERQNTQTTVPHREVRWWKTLVFDSDSNSPH